MPEFIVTGAGGKQVVLQGPEGSTQQEAQDAYDMLERQRWEQRRAQRILRGYDPEQLRLQGVYEEMHPVQRFGVGTATSALETWEGAKQLAGLEGPETEDRLRAIRAREAAKVPGGDVAGTLGHLAGEIAQVAVPTGAVMGMAHRGLLPRNLANLTTAGEAAVSGAQQGLKAVQPGEDPIKTRLGNVALGGAGALLGRSPFGVRPTPEAEVLIRQARQQGLPMRLTPGQQGGGAWTSIEQSLEGSPILGTAIRAHETRGLRDWNRLILNQVAPRGPIQETGTRGFAQLKQQFTDGYREVIESAPERLRPTQAWTDTTRRAVDAQAARLSREQAETLRAEMDTLLNRASTGDIPREEIKQIKGEFDDLRQAALNQGNIRIADGYRELSDSASMLLALNISPQARAQLRDLDSRYGDLLTLGRAHGYKGSVKEGMITPEILLGAIRAEDPSPRKMGFAQGSPEMLETWQTAQESLGRRIPAMGPGTAEKMANYLAIPAAVADPTGIVLPTAAALGGAAALSHPMAPLMRGTLPQRAAGQYLMGPSITPGSLSQIGEVPIEFGFGAITQ